MKFTRKDTRFDCIEILLGKKKKNTADQTDQSGSKLTSCPIKEGMNDRCHPTTVHIKQKNYFWDMKYQNIKSMWPVRKYKAVNAQAKC